MKFNKILNIKLNQDNKNHREHIKKKFDFHKVYHHKIVHTEKAKYFNQK